MCILIRYPTECNNLLTKQTILLLCNNEKQFLPHFVVNDFFVIGKLRNLFDLCAGQIVLPPSPRAPPGTSLFRVCPGPLITLFLPCLALYKHSNYSFVQCPALFITYIFPLTPGRPGGGMGAEQFDRRISLKIPILARRSLGMVQEKFGFL